MQQSRVIEIDGIFVGAAVALPQEQGWRFVAADRRLGKLDGCVAATLTDTRRLAKQILQTWPREAGKLRESGQTG